MATKVYDFTTSENFGNNTLHCKITETTNDSLNASMFAYEVWVSGYGYEYNYNNHLEIIIDGTELFNGDPGSVVDGQIIASGTLGRWVNHNANGTGSITVYCYYRTLRTDSTYYTPLIDGLFTMTVIPRYKLAINAGEGSTISVKRISSPSETTGNISNNDNLYYGDVLNIEFSANSNYAISTHTVNGVEFASGGNYTVAGNVTVASTAMVLASNVTATNGDITGTSNITVTKYDLSYVHSLQYSFGSITGYINSNGQPVLNEVKFANTNILFSIPGDFYLEIPNDKNGICTITCRTYKSMSDTMVLGNPTTCTFVATAAESRCAPQMWCDAEILDDVSMHMTGADDVMIRYISMVQCFNNPTARGNSTIVERTLNGHVMTGQFEEPELIVEPDTNKFVFTATDSRGYTSKEIVTLDTTDYIILTCNPIVARTSPTGSTVTLSVSGNYFNGSFGARNNSLTLRYRYRESGTSTYGSWITIPNSNLSFTSTSYRSVSNITLSGTFDYNKAYDIQINAADGDGDGYELTYITKDLIIRRGIPVFDWGEEDFNVNCDFMLKNVNIFDVFYPVGTVYLSTASTLPATISQMGSWNSVTTGIAGVNGWERIS